MIVMALPVCDFDPTEAAVPWWHLQRAGYKVHFATPEGEVSAADPRLVERGFGLWSPFLMTRQADLERYRQMVESPAFQHPLAYRDLDVEKISALVVPGGHAAGVKTLLESQTMQRLVVELFARERPVAAVCHGVVLLARSRSSSTGHSVLYGRKTTALTNFMELSAWWMTRWHLGNYYRTYPVTVQDEVTESLVQRSDFEAGPWWLRRDTSAAPHHGFVVRDGNYLSARWPGDCHRFGTALLELLAEYEVKPSSSNGDSVGAV